jgi:glycerophosphoryl diester phosphodiesterase
MAAFRAAAELGADGIEFDVMLTRDGIPIIIHDDTLERTTNGKGRVEDFGLKDLQKLDAGAWKDSRFEGERLPTLEEVFVWAQKNTLILNVEIKFYIGKQTPLEEKVLELIERYKMAPRVVISSFNHYALKKISKLSQNKIETAALFSEGLYEPWKYAKQFDCRAIHPYWAASLFENFYKDSHLAGVVIRPWTVNDEKQMKQLRDLGCDAIITDHPDVGLKYR